MKKLFLSLLCVTLAMGLTAQDRKGLTEYKLANGLTVLLWEDHDQHDVTGYVAVRAGAIDEPKEYTGLAHYLEHMMFKGTQRIGAIDWEKEKPYYEEVIRLYDEYAETTDEAKRAELIQKINEASIEEVKYATTEDFFILMDGIGATGVNAFTSYDMTCYHNSFPGNQMYKWLTIFSDRLINPVFRTFQAELENVFEEYNMYEDNPSTAVRNTLMSKLYAGHPYERNVIGLPEHLKNPRLSKLIEFYNTWYVPNNMALILVGDFDTESTKPMIEQTFGRLVAKELPARATYPDAKFDAGKEYSYRLGYYPQVIWAYDGIKVTDDDALALQFVCSLLNNGMGTGLLDKITLDGEVSSAGVSMDARRDMGRILISAIPYYDVNQQQYESNAATKKIVMREVEKLKSGNIPDWLIASVKKDYAQQFITAFEEGEGKMGNLVQCFIYGMPIEDIFTENERIQALTKEDIQRIAKKYFDTTPMTVGFEEGDPKKNKLAKPKIKPLDLPHGVETEYVKQFKALPEGEVKQTYLDLNDVKVVKMDDEVTLHYSQNPKNNIFNLTLRYGIGITKKPMLEYVISLMNRAGVMPQTDNQQFRRRLAELGGRCSYGISDSYMTVQIVGEEENLAEICRLVQTQMLMPKFDTKQFDAVKGSVLSSRFSMSKRDGIQANALREYVLYGDKSDYIDMVPFMDIYHMDELQLKVAFLDATKYALNIYYCGQKPMEEVKNTLAGTLPLQEGMQASTSPEFRDRKKYDKTSIFFLPNTNVQQAKVYFYFEGTPYSTDEAVLYEAFDQYFSAGFTGIVMDEIRTKRSMAYTAYGNMVMGSRPGRNSCFSGYIGTQSDKVADAVETFIGLLDSMPQYPERIDAIKASLLQNAQISKPSFRGKAQTYDYWREMGYTDDPARKEVEQIKNLTFEQIMDFYRSHVKGQPISIIIMGDPKLIDQKRLQAKYGKIQKISKTKLFAPLDLDF